MMAGTRKLRDAHLGTSRAVEFLVRNILFLGFFVLLVLVAGLGYRSVKSVEALEKDSIRVDETEERHLRLVLDISETAGKVFAEIRTVIANEGNKLLQFPAQQRLKDYKKEMDAEIEQGRMSSLVDTEEWRQFEETYRDFWNAMEQSGTASDAWHDERDRLIASVKRVVELVDSERDENNLKMHKMSVSARNRIVAATGAVLVVGVVVALLAFYEIRKYLKRLASAHAATAESRDYLQSLLDSLVSGVVVIRDDGTVQTVSESFRNLPGAGKESASGQRYEELFRNNPPLLAAISDELAQPAASNHYYGRVDLGFRLFDCFTSPLMVAGEHQGIILVFVDVTEATRARAELQRNHALTAVGQMTAQIAHEIKNPLGSIRFAAELLKRKGKNDHSEDLSTIQVIERSVDHLAAIVAQLSEFARPKKLNRSEIQLNDLLEEILPMVADRLNARQMHVEKDYSTEIPAGHFDGTELKKLFLNLIINAIEASEPQSAIELRTKLTGENEISIDIVDRGCGMDADTQRRLFEPFYTTKEKGTGLGMAIAKQIAVLHGGDLSVTSQPGKGTTASVKLPLIKFAEADNRSGAVHRLST
jgi:two-component system, NtrC family, nitrogen regulation sensor histidine kinase GlnL